MPDAERRLRILIINDDRRLVASVERLLEEEGYDVAVAFDGNEGLELFATWTPDLILLDLIMPGMDGWEVLEELFDRPIAPDLRFWSGPSWMTTL